MSQLIRGVVLDTNIVIALYRNQPDAIHWLALQTEPPQITSVTWFEMLEGVQNSAAQRDTEALLSIFPLLSLTDADQAWAIDKLRRYRLARGVFANDMLIAAVADRLQQLLLTLNTKDMLKVLPPSLVVRPF